MEKKYFPLYVDISEKKIVVIGGGVIATRRVKTLLGFTENIVVAAPEITVELQELHEQGCILWLQECYHIGLIQDADMVIAATNQPEINHQVKADCCAIEKETGHQVLVSVIDDKNLCDFYFPSIIQNGEMVIGINSGGKSPSKTKEARQKIEALLDCESIYES